MAQGSSNNLSLKQNPEPLITPVSPHSRCFRLVERTRTSGSVAMSGPVEDVKRNLERKPDGSNPEPPYKKQANTEEDEEVTSKWAMQLMTKID